MEELLTAEEVEKLPNGTKVIITWSGGNGPHRYVIQRIRYGTIIARMPGEKHLRPKNHTINFVGKERYHTHVSLDE